MVATLFRNVASPCVDVNAAMSVEEQGKAHSPMGTLFAVTAKGV